MVFRTKIISQPSKSSKLFSSKLTFTYLMSTLKTLEKGVKYVQC